MNKPIKIKITLTVNNINNLNKKYTRKELETEIKKGLEILDIQELDYNLEFN